MRELINTGNQSVDMMAQINFTGNVIPASWYKSILRDNGKPYLLAICILSEICYWYRPTEIRDEQTGNIVGYRKRFHEDLLQKDYQSLAELFGESKASIKAAMDRLEELGLIKRVWRNLISNGRALPNILYIDLNVQRLYEATFGREKDSEQDGNTSVQFEQKLEEKDRKIPETPEISQPPKFWGRGTKILRDTPESFEGGVPKNWGRGTRIMGDTPENHEGGLPKFWGTNTENTIEITPESISENINEITSEIIYRNSPSHLIPSDRIGKEKSTNSAKGNQVRKIRQELQRRVEYDSLSQDSRFSKSSLDELIEIMVEVYVTEADVVIKGVTIPWQLLRERMDQYDYLMMEYVLLSLKENRTDVGNVKKYLLSTLFNAPATKNNKYQQEVQHDFG